MIGKDDKKASFMMNVNDSLGRSQDDQMSWVLEAAEQIEEDERLSDCSAEVPSEHDDEERKDVDPDDSIAGQAVFYKPSMYDETYHKASVLK